MQLSASLASSFGRVRRGERRWLDYEPLAYALVAGAVTLWVASLFYSSVRLQTLYSHLWSFPEDFDRVVRDGTLGQWSAPLDDVFIYFDFARATARGFPFQWSEGNGYSTGGTSITYPLVLALGYRLGFFALELMFFAAWLATVSVFAFLLCARRAFARLPWFAVYLCPPLLLSVGALDWTLWSGMEVAFFLAIWGGAFVAWHRWLDTMHFYTVRLDTVRLDRPNLDTLYWAAPGSWRPAALVGALGAVLTLTRPEAVVCVAAFSLGGAVPTLRRDGMKRALAAISWSALPAALVVAIQSQLNYWLTGSRAAAGAVTKLELYDPYATAAEIADSWAFFVNYQLERITLHHFAEGPVGWVLWPLAAVALFIPATRRSALLLWFSAAGWVLLVALNGQVRWQNERYVMPAVAWFLLLVALGAGGLLGMAYEFVRTRRRLGGGIALIEWVGASLGVFLAAQHPRFTDQLWFFGRAARNIFDQQLRTGQIIREELRPAPKRVLVGDAGAIPYASDLPALDLIGLGGYRALPFAEANQAGLGAALELLEALPPRERPDLLALYPSWWGSLTDWFGRKIGEVPVRGNVICGAASKVLYRPDWSPFSASALPGRLSATDLVVDELDVADLVSERAHGFEPVGTRPGYVAMKILPTGPEPTSDPLWDAGRIGRTWERYAFRLRGGSPGKTLRLVFRVAPFVPAEIEVSVNGGRPQVLRIERQGHWIEPDLALATEDAAPMLEVVVRALGKPHLLCHVWAVEAPAEPAPALSAPRTDRADRPLPAFGGPELGGTPPQHQPKGVDNSGVR